MGKSFVNNKNNTYLCTQKNGSNGLMAERLGRGLQNLVQRFESASDLQNPFYTAVWRGFTFFTPKFTPTVARISDLKNRQKPSI